MGFVTTIRRSVAQRLSAFRAVSLDALRPHRAGLPDGVSADVSGAVPALPRWLIGIFVVLACTRIVLVAVLPVQAYSNAIYDDALFLRSASYISQGQWLGPYDQLTLLKGPTYALFISLCHMVGLPLRLGEQLLCVAFCFVLVVALKPAVSRAWVLLLVFAAALFDPLWWLHRTVREPTFIPLAGLTFACLFGFVLRRHLPLRWAYVWAAGLGCSLVCFWMIREEGMWILPPLLLALAWAGWTVLRHHPRPLLWCLACCVPAVIWFAGDLTVCLLNWKHYGVFAVTEVKSREFLAANAALCRITPNEAPLYGVLVSKEVRRLAYGASPAFRELQPSLEGPVGQAFASYSAQEAPEKDMRGEMTAGHFAFALRDAVVMAGHGKSGGDALKFYAQIAAEINEACDRGLLPCRSRRAFLLLPWDARSVPLFPAAFGTVVKTFWSLEGMDEGLDFAVGPSVGDEQALAPFRELTHCTLAPTDPPLMRLTGMAFSPTALLDLRILSPGRNLLTSTLTWSDSPGLYMALRQRGQDIPHAAHAQFTLVFPRVEKGDLAVLADGKLLVSLPLDGQGKRVDSPSLQLWVNNMQPEAVDLTEMKGPRMAVLRCIDLFYQKATLPLGCMALAAFLLQCGGLFCGRPFVLPFLELVLLVAVAARMAAIAVADTIGGTCAHTYGLLLCVHVLFMVFCVLALCDAVPAGRAIYRRLRPRPPSPAAGPLEVDHSISVAS